MNIMYHCTDTCMNNYCLFQSISNCVTLLLPLVESYRVLQIESPKLMLFSKQHFVTVYTFPVIIIAYHIMEPTSLLQSLIIKLNKTKNAKLVPLTMHCHESALKRVARNGLRRVF